MEENIRKVIDELGKEKKKYEEKILKGGDPIKVVNWAIEVEKRRFTISYFYIILGSK